MKLLHAKTGGLQLKRSSRYHVYSRSGKSSNFDLFFIQETPLLWHLAIFLGAAGLEINECTEIASNLLLPLICYNPQIPETLNRSLASVQISL